MRKPLGAEWQIEVDKRRGVDIPIAPHFATVRSNRFEHRSTSMASEREVVRGLIYRHWAASRDVAIIEPIR